MSSLKIDLSITTNDLSTYVYRDIAPEFTINQTAKDINSNDDYTAIEGGIVNLFTFKRGQRIINPEFGNSLDQYLYESVNDLTANKIGNEIYNMFDKWEPRVQITNISIAPKPDDNSYFISISYTVPTLSKKIIKLFNVAISAMS